MTPKPDTADPDPEIIEAYRNGHAAYKEGEPESLCPYALPILHHAWMAGWHKGKLDDIMDGIMARYK